MHRATPGAMSHRERWRSGPGICPACSWRMISITSSGSSATLISPNSACPILPSASTVSCSQDSSPDQYDRPTSTIGNLVILPVATRVSASNSSSMLP